MLLHYMSTICIISLLQIGPPTPAEAVCKCDVPNILDGIAFFTFPAQRPLSKSTSSRLTKTARRQLLAIGLRLRAVASQRCAISAKIPLAEAIVLGESLHLRATNHFRQAEVSACARPGFT